MLTWYVVSNLSYIKRVIILVFPTLWSPRNTNLYFARGVTVDILLFLAENLQIYEEKGAEEVNTTSAAAARYVEMMKFLRVSFKREEHCC